MMTLSYHLCGVAAARRLFISEFTDKKILIDLTNNKYQKLKIDYESLKYHNI